MIIGDVVENKATQTVGVVVRTDDKMVQVFWWPSNKAGWLDTKNVNFLYHSHE